MMEIYLTREKVAIVDDEDYQRLSEYHWCAHKDQRGYFYANRARWENGNKIQIIMHRDIMGCQLNDRNIVDHINGNTLDNRKANLRIVTRRQNSQNRHKPKSSSYVGVYYHKESKKWRSQIMVSGRMLHLGCFEDEFAAFQSYVVANTIFVEGE